MTVSTVLDAAGRRRSPATMPGYHAGRTPRNKGQLYPADPPTVEEIIAVMRQTADDRHGARLRALIVLLWRGGLRVQEALALGERDLDPRRGSARASGQGRPSARDRHGRLGLGAAVALARPRIELPVGPLFCIIDGPTRGRSWSSAGSAPSSAGWRPRRESAAGSRRISCAMRTLLNSLVKAYRSTSFSASSATPTSARPASTCRASTPRRSSPPCTPGGRR